MKMSYSNPGIRLGIYGLYFAKVRKVSDMNQIKLTGRRYFNLLNCDIRLKRIIVLLV
jgi:hypothetical protein